MSEWQGEHGAVGPRPAETVLEYLMGSRTRARLVVRLLDPTRRDPWIRDLVREVGTGASAVLREIDEFERIGLVDRRREGGACFLRINHGHPLYAALWYMVNAAGKTPRGSRPWGRIARDASPKRTS